MTDKPDKLHIFRVKCDDGVTRYLNPQEKDALMNQVMAPLRQTRKLKASDIRALIQEAPTVALLQKVMHRIVHLKTSPNTRCQWQNECMLRAKDFIYDSPKDGLNVYSSLFTFLRDEQQTHLLEIAKRNQARTCPQTSPNSTASS